MHSLCICNDIKSVGSYEFSYTYLGLLTICDEGSLITAEMQFPDYRIAETALLSFPTVYREYLEKRGSVVFVKPGTDPAIVESFIVKMAGNNACIEQELFNSKYSFDKRATVITEAPQNAEKGKKILAASLVNIRSHIGKIPLVSGQELEIKALKEEVERLSSAVRALSPVETQKSNSTWRFFKG